MDFLKHQRLGKTYLHEIPRSKSAFYKTSSTLNIRLRISMNED